MSTSPPGPPRQTTLTRTVPDLASTCGTTRHYYEYIRDNDLTLTHSLINLQRSRSIAGTFNLSDDAALRVIRETDAGIVVRGARVLATLGPLADEIAVYSPRLARQIGRASCRERV